MPIFEFLCKKCGHKFEELVLSSENIIPCPQCDSTNLVKEFSVFGVSAANASANLCGTGACDMPSPSCCGGGECPGCDCK
jgi:putative FmdB family regulatory protein